MNNSIIKCRDNVFNHGSSYLYILPHQLLRPYIAHYCLTFPNRQTMSDGYTVLPSASTVIVASNVNEKIQILLKGTSTKAVIVGADANQCDGLLLIKFRAGGFYHMYGFNQCETVNGNIDFFDIDKRMAQEIVDMLTESESAGDLAAWLDGWFLRHLNVRNRDLISAVTQKIVTRNGNITANMLSEEFFYSEKHIRRLFLQRIGVSPKVFSRIVRANYALQLLQDEGGLPAKNGVKKAGYYDHSHLLRDFKGIFNLTPGDYVKNMSDFYNAEII